MSRTVSLISVLLFTSLFYVYIVMAQTPSPYIYRIKASQCDHYPTSRQLTGFRLYGKKGIVTALHGVIDCRSITAVTEAPNGQNFVDLEIREVDVERDVALLSSSTLDRLLASEGIYPVSSLDNVENQYFSVVGYPVGLLKQTQSAQALILVKKLLKSLIPYQYQKELRTRNSPNPSISVLQIQTHLLPGHSGAPVLDSTNRVVGVGNGGLEGGYGEIGWLIPITDIQWQSALAEQLYLEEVRGYDPQLALGFSSTYPGKSPSPAIVSTPVPVYRSTSTPTRAYRPASAPDKNCDCSANFYDCSDFATQADAQACYWNCGAQNKGDIHKLDFNIDGTACEEYFFRSPTSASTATYRPIPTATSRPTSTPKPPTPAPKPTLSSGSTYIDPIVGATYVYVPAGEFIMGSSNDQRDYAYELCVAYRDDCHRSYYEREQPQHMVYLDAYWIMETELTNEQYGEFMDAGGYTTKAYWSEVGWAWRTENNITEPDSNWKNSDFNDPTQPIIDISWYEAEAYANWLSAETGLDFGLPTETQWEKAARGATGHHFPWGNEWDSSSVNYCDKNCTRYWADKEGDDGYPDTAPVGSYPTGISPYGALDMAGNVWEWTATWYNGYYDDTLLHCKPMESESGTPRVLRGGSWIKNPEDVRATSRDQKRPNCRQFDIGFRLRLYLDR